MTALSDPVINEPVIDTSDTNENARDSLQMEVDPQVWRVADSAPVTVTPPERVVRVETLRHFHLVRMTNLMWLATMMLEFIFAMRFILKLMDANPSAGFAVFVYNTSRLFLVPFFGLTATPSAHGAVLEIPTIIAMIVYAIWAWLIVHIVWVVFDEPVSPRRLRLGENRRVGR